MFGFFKRKTNTLQTLEDLNGKPLKEGDKVKSLRYELGECTLLLEDENWFYFSETSGEKVSYIKMIDASTKRQKVLLIHEN